MKKRYLVLSGAVMGAALMVMQALPVKACTELYVGKDVSATGRTIYGRTEDGGAENLKLYDVKEAGAIKANSTLKDAQGLYYKWGSRDSFRYTSVRDGKELWDGKSETCYEAQGTNEYGVTISATESLYENEAVETVDPYYMSEEPGKQGIGEQSLTTIVLGQATTAREGVDIICAAVDKYHASEASGIMVSDGNESWYIEIVSGSTYAAYKLPDDIVFVNPNVTIMKNVNTTGATNRAATTGTDFVVSKNLISVAKKAGTYTDIYGRTGAEADGTTIDLNLSYSDKAESKRMKTALDFLNPSLGVTTDNSTFKFAFKPNRSLTMDDVREFFRLDNIARRSTMECTIFEYYNNASDNYVQGNPMSVVEWRTMGAPRYSIYVPFYPMLLNDTPAAYQEETYEYNDKSAYYAFQRVQLMGNLLPETKGKNIIADFANTENSIKSEFASAQATLAGKSGDDARAYATELANTLSAKAIESAHQTFLNNYLPTVKAPAGSSVTVNGVTGITDANIQKSADKAYINLKKQVEKIQVGKKDGKAIYAGLNEDSYRLFDLNATGSGNVNIEVGSLYAGNIAYVCHYVNGKWETKQATIAEDGTVTVDFASFSPVFVVATDTDTLTAGSPKTDVPADNPFGIFAIMAIAATGLIVMRKKAY